MCTGVYRVFVASSYLVHSRGQWRTLWSWRLLKNSSYFRDILLAFSFWDPRDSERLLYTRFVLCAMMVAAAIFKNFFMFLPGVDAWTIPSYCSPSPTQPHSYQLPHPVRSRPIAHKCCHNSQGRFLQITHQIMESMDIQQENASRRSHQHAQTKKCAQKTTRTVDDANPSPAIMDSMATL